MFGNHRLVFVMGIVTLLFLLVYEVVVVLFVYGVRGALLLTSLLL
jgi:hypothetical protein